VDVVEVCVCEAQAGAVKRVEVGEDEEVELGRDVG